MKNVLLAMGLLMVGSVTLAAEGSPALNCNIWDSSTNETIVQSEKDKTYEANGYQMYTLKTSKGNVVVDHLVGTQQIGIIAKYLQADQVHAIGLGKVLLDVDGLFINCTLK